MTVKIGLVVPIESRWLFELGLEGLEGVQPIWAVYTDELSIKLLVNQFLPDMDAICFAGPLPLEYARKSIPDGMPFVEIKPSPVDIALSLIRVRSLGIELTPGSIDTVPKKMVEDLFNEMGSQTNRIAVMPFEGSATPEDIVAFHREQRLLLGSRYVITGRNSVFKILDGSSDIPVIKILPTVATIAATVRELALEAVSIRKEDLRLSAAVFLATDPKIPASAGSSYSEIIRNILLGDPQWKNAWVEAISDSKVLVLGHKKLMQDKTLQWRSLEILHEMSMKTETQVVAGFGLGISAQACITYAHQAADLAAKQDTACAYLFTDHGLVIGPMNDKNVRASRYLFKSDESSLLGLMENTRLGVSTLTRLIDLEKQLGDSATSAGEIGMNLQVTATSARRIVRTLRDHELVTSVGFSQPAKRGRPMQLYRLNIQKRLNHGRAEK